MRYKKSLSLSLSWVMVPGNGAVPATKSKDGFTSFPNVTCWTSQARLPFTRRLWRLSKNNYWSLIDTDKHITYHARPGHAQDNCQSSPKSLCHCHWEPRLCMVCRCDSKNDLIKSPLLQQLQSHARIASPHLQIWHACDTCACDIHVTCWTSRSPLSLRFTRRTMWQCVAKSLCDCPLSWSLRAQALNGFANGGFALLCSWHSNRWSTS